jgi:hypothetical protein
LRSGDRDVAQNTTLVVDHVAVAAAGSFDLFDDSGLKEVGQPPPDLPGLSLPEEEAEAFLDRPRSLNLFCRVADLEGSPEPVPLLR